MRNINKNDIKIDRHNRVGLCSYNSLQKGYYNKVKKHMPWINKKKYLLNQ